MIEVPLSVPRPPDWRVAWDELNEACLLVRALAGCPQDPVHHAEGDVWIHTRMVCEALADLPAWRELPEDERTAVFLAAVFHDAGKPDCTRIEDGRISSRGHSRRGAILARNFLWRLDVPFTLREQVCNMIVRHQAPYYLSDRPDSQRLCLEISHISRCDWLAILSEADVRGRTCADQHRLLNNIALFAELAHDQGCFDQPRPFASDHARFLYFQSEARHPDAPAHEDHKAEVVLMSGLPGSGKDHYLRIHLPDWPVVSLDQVREELAIAPDEEQGEVIVEARTRARELLRQEKSFAWNATNITAATRRTCISLFAAYHARVRIVYVEAPASALFEQNSRRTAAVPRKVLDRLLDRWEVPLCIEAHRVEPVVWSAQQE
jgi:predicted kinase